MVDDNSDGDIAEILERHEFGTASWGIPKSSKCRHCGSGIEPGQGWERRVDAQGKEIVQHTTPLYFDECTDGETRRTLRRMGFCPRSCYKGQSGYRVVEAGGTGGLDGHYDRRTPFACAGGEAGHCREQGQVLHSVPPTSGQVGHASSVRTGLMQNEDFRLMSPGFR